MNSPVVCINLTNRFNLKNKINQEELMWEKVAKTVRRFSLRLSFLTVRVIPHLLYRLNLVVVLKILNLYRDIMGRVKKFVWDGLIIYDHFRITHFEHLNHLVEILSYFVIVLNRI
jgi:hypothetical protein